MLATLPVLATAVILYWPLPKLQSKDLIAAAASHSHVHAACLACFDLCPLLELLPLQT